MASAYELVACTRPRIRRDLLFTKTPDGVLFHNAEGGFSLTAGSAYKFASLLVPHLDGRHRVDDICAALGPSHREMVGELVKALYERDFARDVPVPAAPVLPAEVADRFAAQVAYIEHYRDDAQRRFAAFRDARVAVLGTDRIARWCALSLVRNGCAQLGVPAGLDGMAEVQEEVTALAAAGCPVELTAISAADAVGAARPAGVAGSVGVGRDSVGWADLAGYSVVVVTGAAGALRLLAAGVPAGVTLLPVWTLGGRAVVGPLCAAGQAGCWVCAALRLGANGDSGAAADLWRGVALPAAAADGLPSGPVAAMLGNLLGYEVFRLTTGALPAETAGKVIIQNLETLDVLAEPVLPHPSCPHCAEPGQTPDLAGALADAPAVELQAGVDAAEAADRAAEAAIADLNERMVLVGRHAGVFTRFTDEPWVQTPLKVSTLELALGPGRHRQVAAFDVHHVAGARQRALRAAAGVYAEHVRGAGAAAPTTPVAGRVDPAALAVATGLGAEPAGWAVATSLLSGEAWLVPAGALHPSGPANRGAFTVTRAGVGAGASPVEAARRGLLSGVGHLALTRALRGTAAVAAVDLDTAAGHPELRFLTRSAANLEVGVELLELAPGGLAGVHVLLARAADPADPDAAPSWRLATDPDWARAAVAALRDLLGAVQLGRQLPAGEPVDDGDPLLPDLAAGTLLPAAQQPARLDARGGWAAVKAGLRSAGLDALAADTTTADLRRGGLATARVLLLGRNPR